jgi:radical SAM-linked protein
VHYRRRGDSRLYSHLEIMQLIFRSLRRAGLPVLHSQGYNPSPRVSFSNALPLGTESDAEYFDVELADPLQDYGRVVTRLNRGMPPGMEVRDIGEVPAGRSDRTLVSYRIGLSQPLNAARLENIERFLRRESCIMQRQRKDRVREIDLRPLVRTLEADDEVISLQMLSIQGRAGAGPRDVLRLAVGLPEEEVLLARVLKTGVADFSASA